MEWSCWYDKWNINGFGSATEFENAAIEDVSVAYDSGNDKVVMCSYEDAGNSNYGTAVVGTGGTSISFGSAATFSANTLVLLHLRVPAMMQTQ